MQEPLILDPYVQEIFHCQRGFPMTHLPQSEVQLIALGNLADWDQLMG